MERSQTTGAVLMAVPSMLMLIFTLGVLRKSYLAVALPVLGAVGVDAGEKDLPRAEIGRAPGPLDGIQARGFRARPGVYAVPAVLPPGVDRDDHALGPEIAGGFRQDPGVFDRGGIDGDLVGPGAERLADIIVGPYPPPMVRGMKGRSAVRRAISRMVRRASRVAVMSRKTISSAPSAS